MLMKCKLKKYDSKTSNIIEVLQSNVGNIIIQESVVRVGEQVEMDFLENGGKVKIGKFEDVKSHKKKLYITTDECYVEIEYIEDYKEVALA